jgi:hypothetical protein
MIVLVSTCLPVDIKDPELTFPNLGARSESSASMAGCYGEVCPWVNRDVSNSFEVFETMD